MAHTHQYSTHITPCISLETYVKNHYSPTVLLITEPISSQKRPSLIPLIHSSTTSAHSIHKHTSPIQSYLHPNHHDTSLKDTSLLHTHFTSTSLRRHSPARTPPLHYHSTPIDTKTLCSHSTYLYFTPHTLTYLTSSTLNTFLPNPQQSLPHLNLYRPHSLPLNPHNQSTPTEPHSSTTHNISSHPCRTPHLTRLSIPITLYIASQHNTQHQTLSSLHPPHSSNPTILLPNTNNTTPSDNTHQAFYIPTPNIHILLTLLLYTQTDFQNPPREYSHLLHAPLNCPLQNTRPNPSHSQFYGLS